MIKVFVLLVLFNLCSCALVSSYFEVHPSSQLCGKTCNKKFSGEDAKCGSCCSGCRFLAIQGLRSENGVLSSEDTLDTCYKACDEGFKVKLDEKAACHIGCDEELKFAEEDLKQLSSSNLEMPSFMSDIFNMMSMFNNGFADGSDDAKTDDQTFFLNGVLPVKFSDDMPLVQDSKNHEISIASNDRNPFMLRDSYDPSPRAEDDGPFSEARLEQLKKSLRDRNTVHVLLVSSVTACLFAILWMVCNSSNDPIRVVPAKSSQEPPAYDTLYVEKKKLPLMFVSGFQEEAPPLPIKVIPGVTDI